MQPPTIRLASARESVQVRLDDGRILEGPVGAPLEAFVRSIAHPDEPPIVAALVDGHLRELTQPVNKDVDVCLISNATSDGKRIYQRSLTLLMLAAVHELYPDAQITVDHAVTMYGLLCEVRGRPAFTASEVKRIEARMREIVDQDAPIVKREVPLQEAIAIFEKQGYEDKVRLLKYRRRNEVVIYSLLETVDYFYGYMAPSAGYLRYFELVPHNLGFVLCHPRRGMPTQLPRGRESPKLDQVFLEYSTWMRALQVSDVAHLNEAIESGRIRQVILVSEALHEQRVVEIAAKIVERARPQARRAGPQVRRDPVRLVLIAGPSSSGKTTFSKRLAIQLLAHGLRPVPVEMDNYFVDRSRTPLDESGAYDFEHLHALDLPLFNEQLAALLEGREVRVPRFDFQTGSPTPGERLRVGPRDILIVEGIHGMNPELVGDIPAECIYRVYISALTQLNVDHHNRISTTDNRLLRRIVRDAQYRGYPAEETINRWESVRRGEEKWVFPYQENADEMFNSALAYELAVLKPYVEPLLRLVEPGTLAYVESKRWLAFLQWFLPCAPDLVPDNSILREFVGGSILRDFPLGQARS